MPFPANPRPRALRMPLASLLLTALLVACATTDIPAPKPSPVAAPPAVAPKPLPPIRVGVALGGGAAKGFAHIGVIKMLEASGIQPVVVSGTSAGSVVGALYASGMDAFQMQRQAFALDEDRIRDVSLFSGGVIKGQKLQDYVNQLVVQQPIERMPMPFAAVATQLETGKRMVFTRGNTGQAVRASSSIPGVFEPVAIGKFHYVDGGIVSPVPVDAARQLGAEFVIAIDISTRASGKATPASLLGNLNQSITIMGQQLGRQELARADIVIRPTVSDIGPADFEQRNNAILEGERAALAAMPQIRAKLAQLRQARAAALAPVPKPASPKAVPAACGGRFGLARLRGRPACGANSDG